MRKPRDRATPGKAGKAPKPEQPPKPEPTPNQRALKLLGSRERTSRELSSALERQGVEPEARAAALARMQELGYIDDASVAQGRARRLQKKGEAPRLIEQRLVRQGIEQGTARSAAQGAVEGQSELQQAAAALEQRLRGRPVRDEKERQRLLRFLMARGHRAAAAWAALRGRPVANAGAAGDVEGFQRVDGEDASSDADDLDE